MAQFAQLWSQLPCLQARPHTTLPSNHIFALSAPDTSYSEVRSVCYNSESDFFQEFWLRATLNTILLEVRYPNKMCLIEVEQ